MSAAGPISVAALGGLESPARTAALVALAARLNAEGAGDAATAAPPAAPAAGDAASASCTDRDAIEQGLGLAPGALAGQQLAELRGQLAAVDLQISGCREERAQMERNLCLAPGALSRAAA